MVSEVAEGVGFEPTDPLSRVARFRNECLKPDSANPLRFGTVPGIEP